MTPEGAWEGPEKFIISRRACLMPFDILLRHPTIHAASMPDATSIRRLRLSTIAQCKSEALRGNQTGDRRRYFTPAEMADPTTMLARLGQPLGPARNGLHFQVIPKVDEKPSALRRANAKPIRPRRISSRQSVLSLYFGPFFSQLAPTSARPDSADTQRKQPESADSGPDSIQASLLAATEQEYGTFSNDNSTSNFSSDSKVNTAVVLPRLAALPTELQLQIIAFLSFADIIRLRQTCRFYYGLATKDVVGSVIGPERFISGLLSTCRTCLLQDDSRLNLLVDTREHERATEPEANDPFDTHHSHESAKTPINNHTSFTIPTETQTRRASAPQPNAFRPLTRCTTCLLRASDPRLRVGRKVELASLDSVWVCRWCGWPVNGPAAFGHVQFHRGCYARYGEVLCRFFALGWVQFGLGVVGWIVALKGWKGVGGVWVPAMVSENPTRERAEV
jgi:hypothetical protein